MSDNMARSKADDTRDPANFLEDNGLRLCKECQEMIKVDLFDAKEAEVEEFDNCYAHLRTVDELQEYAFNKVREIVGLKAEYKKWFEWKDARIHELETRLADMTRLVELGLKLDELRREET